MSALLALKHDVRRVAFRSDPASSYAVAETATYVPFGGKSQFQRRDFLLDAEGTRVISLDMPDVHLESSARSWQYYIASVVASSDVRRLEWTADERTRVMFEDEMYELRRVDIVQRVFSKAGTNCRVKVQYFTTCKVVEGGCVDSSCRCLLLVREEYGAGAYCFFAGIPVDEADVLVEE